MNRIKRTFDELASAGKKALIPYITPEFPVRDATIPLLHALERSGADLIELGIPFSDPLADGKTIQRASDIAIRNGVTLQKILAAVKEFRGSSAMPILLMGYSNTVVRYGIHKFFLDCASAGVDGLILPDLPPEESTEIVKKSKEAEISNVFLIAPTTPPGRIRTIDALSTDFSYCVSVTGVTGVRAELGINGSLDVFLQRVKQHTKKPFVVGFGISTAKQIERVWQHADGVVVGSALLQKIAEAETVDASVEKAEVFLRSLRS